MKYGRYQVVEEIGKGSMGVVYKAHDPNLDLMVALKVMRPDRVESEAFVKRFLAEARVLGRLDHPNIVRVYNVDEDRETVYIAMEFIEGEALSDRMRNKQFTPEEIIELGAIIAGSLGYAHKRGIVHRDVKPSNILIKSDDSLKITDFGIAHIQDTSAAEMTQAGEILGTPAYMSPEQVKSQQVDGRSDLFSLGIILYELCTGTRPFKGENISAIFQAITQEEPVDITRINRAIPGKLANIIMKCLRKKPDARFTTGEALAEALTGCLVKKEPVVSVSPAARKRRMLIISAAVAVMILGTGIGFGIYHFAATPKAESSRPGGSVMSSSLKIESNPSGAKVIIDGDGMGQTPLKQKLSTGEHEVRVSMPHYYDWKAQVLLTEEAEVPLSVRLNPIRGK